MDTFGNVKIAQHNKLFNYKIEAAASYHGDVTIARHVVVAMVTVYRVSFRILCHQCLQLLHTLR